MQVVVHIGPHRTASKHIQKHLELNRRLLEDQGTYVADRNAARDAINEAGGKILDAKDPDAIRAEMLEKIIGTRSDVKTLVLSNEYLSGRLSRPIGKALFYPRARDLVSRIRALFAGHEMRIFSAVRNPGTFIPSCYSEGVRAGDTRSFNDYISDANLPGLRWSSFLHRVQGQDEEQPLVVWRYEDYPFFWRRVIQEMTGIRNREDLIGTTEIVQQGLSLRGAELLNKFLQNHPPETPQMRASVLAEFQKLYPSSNVDYGPFWPADLVEGLTENYDDDWYYIERMENVMALTP